MASSGVVLYMYDLKNNLKICKNCFCKEGDMLYECNNKAPLKFLCCYLWIMLVVTNVYVDLLMLCVGGLCVFF